MRKIVILGGTHLCHNPRVIKEAIALAEAGFDVEILGAWFSQGLADRDIDLAAGQPFRYTPVFRLFSEDGKRSLAGNVMRARRWVGHRAVSWLALQTPAALGYGLDGMLGAARRHDADLFIAHSEPMLWVAARLSQAGRRIAVDVEDWFSEDYLKPGRPRRLIRRLETEVLAAAAHVTCTSRVMSAALRAEYGCPEPCVIYNAFPWHERAGIDGLLRDRRNTRVRSIHWFSQAVGPDRGLEDLFAALPHLKVEVEVHIRGTAAGSNLVWFEGAVPPDWRARVFLHPEVSNRELLSRIAEHDIGLALERCEPRNKDLTVSNKILQYLQAGLAVVATSTRGQCEVAEAAPGAVELYKAGDALELAARLNRFLESPTRLQAAREAALSAARTTFAWENMAPRLVAGIERACSWAPA